MRGREGGREAREAHHLGPTGTARARVWVTVWLTGTEGDSEPEGTWDVAQAHHFQLAFYFVGQSYS